MGESGEGAEGQWWGDGMNLSGESLVFLTEVNCAERTRVFLDISIAGKSPERVALELVSPSHPIPSSPSTPPTDPKGSGEKDKILMGFLQP